ncbi:MAG: hypothetical protein JWP52_2233, partial [Rhizobacter sp.]|nr:hypothetical protein [Rhizobacter sp.]
MDELHGNASIKGKTHREIRMRQLSVQQIALAGFVVLAATVLTLSVTTWTLTQETRCAAAFVSHTQDVIGTMRETESALYRAEAGQRGYLISRKAEFSQERDAAAQSVVRGLGQLEDLTDDNEQQQKRLLDLRKGVAGRISSYRDAQARVAAGGDLPIEAGLANGQRAIAEIQPLFESFITEESRLLNRRVQEEQDRGRRAGLALGTLVLVLVIAMPLFYLRLRREFTGRAL